MHSKSTFLLYLIQERLHETETHDTIKVAIPEDEPPNSPPTCEPLQASTHVTEKYNKGLHESVTKAEGTTTSARRQLLMDNIEGQPSANAKRPKQE